MSRSSVNRSPSAIIQEAMLRLAVATSGFGYPLSLEKMQIDENTSLWASYTPDYTANPPLKENIRADLAIIGGGFTGVSTAYHFSQRYPDKRVVLLEAKKLANGASGRNGGMMLNWIAGGASETEELTLKHYQTTRDAIDMIVGIIQEHGLDVSYRRDGSMTVYTDTQRAEAAHEHTEHLQSIGIDMHYYDRSQLNDAIQLQGGAGATVDMSEGQLNGAQFIRVLKPVLEAQGVEIYEYTPVTKITEGQQIVLDTAGGTVTADAIVLATNGYTGKLGYFRKAILPLHSHVFATEPLSPAQQNEIGWHKISGYSDDYDRISYSVMTNEGHIVFGGGSNRSYDYLWNNKTAYPGTPDRAQAGFDAMQKTMHDYLPKTKGLKLAHRWTGTLGVTLRRNMSLGVRGEHNNVYYSVGYCGHGVTAANLAGKILTDVYSGNAAAWEHLGIINAPFDPFPLEPFRWMGYHMMTRLTGKAPRI